MTRADQKKFVREVSENIAKDICKLIDEGKVPEGWDGHELRHLMANRHNDSASMSNPMSNKRGARYREFKNTVIVNNL